jgi:hypothetical protein
MPILYYNLFIALVALVALVALPRVTKEKLRAELKIFRNNIYGRRFRVCSGFVPGCSGFLDFQKPLYLLVCSDFSKCSMYFLNMCKRKREYGDV